MFDVILATNLIGGIGNNGTIPWDCKEDLKLFRQLTLGRKLLVGRKTLDTLPVLKDRTVFCWSRDKKDYKGYTCINNLDDIEDDFIIAGGAELYNKIFSNYLYNVRHVYLSIINNNTECDKFVDIDISRFIILEEKKYESFTFYKLALNVGEEKEYLDLLKDVLDKGVARNGRNGETKSLFGKTLEFNLETSYPLLTTKKMFFKVYLKS